MPTSTKTIPPTIVSIHQSDKGPSWKTASKSKVSMFITYSASFHVLYCKPRFISIAEPKARILIASVSLSLQQPVFLASLPSPTFRFHAPDLSFGYHTHSPPPPPPQKQNDKFAVYKVANWTLFLFPFVVVLYSSFIQVLCGFYLTPFHPSTVPVKQRRLHLSKLPLFESLRNLQLWYRYDR